MLYKYTAACNFNSIVGIPGKFKIDRKWTESSSYSYCVKWNTTWQKCWFHHHQQVDWNDLRNMFFYKKLFIFRPMNVQANLGPSMYFDHSVSIHHLLNWHGRHLYISLIKMFSAEHCKIIFVALINNKVRESLLSLSYVYARIIYLFITFRVEIIFIRLQQNHKKGNLWKCLMFQWYSLHCFSTKTIW